MKTKNPILEAKNINKTYLQASGFFLKRHTKIKALNDVSLSIREGQTIALVGESGSGKSTLARCLLQLQTIDSGILMFNGKDVHSLNLRELKSMQREVQMVFQDPYASLNPRMKVKDIIEEGLVIHKIGTTLEREKKVTAMIKRVGLSRLDLVKYPHEFSGGQRQRIGIARALVVEPKLVICDEPVSALDVSIQAQILILLKSLQKEMGLSYLFISHDLRVVRHIADEILVMYQGEIVERGNVEKVYKTPKANYTKHLLNSIPGKPFKFNLIY
jgi:peptide/nickel transport system ATP-binding protein/oligopeptide transport system ATP-binding protein